MQRLLRPIRLTDWERVWVYAPRVKKLYCIDDEKLSAIFPALALGLPDNLLCNLRNLVWWYPQDDFQYIRLFLTPGLTHLYLGAHAESDSALSVFSTLALKCPRLKDIHINSSFKTEQTVGDPETQVVSLFIQELHHIESIYVHVLDAKAVEHLARLSTLKSLILDAVPAGLTFPPINETDIFPALRALRLRRIAVEPTTRFLSLCHELQLVSFNVSIFALYTTAEMHSLLAAISSHISHSSLTSLAVGHYHGRQDPTCHLMNSHSIRQLLCFVNLTSLSIKASGGFDFDNATVFAMAHAWPLVETLLLSVVFPVQHPRATLECLRYFTHCPKLRMLEITVDCPAAPPAEHAITTSASQCTLIQLNVGFSTISAPPVSIARFISDVFPSLQEIRTCWDFVDTDSYQLYQQRNRFRPRWQEVDSEIRDGALLTAASNLIESGMLVPIFSDHV